MKTLPIRFVTKYEDGSFQEEIIMFPDLLNDEESENYFNEFLKEIKICFPKYLCIKDILKLGLISDWGLRKMIKKNKGPRSINYKYGKKIFKTDDFVLWIRKYYFYEND